MKGNELVSVKIPRYLHEIIVGLSHDTHVPIQKLVELLLIKSPKIRRIIEELEVEG